jgi:hypothetical protein
MKAWLMYSGRDLDPAREPTTAEQALTQDLELGTLWSAMAAGDDYLAGQARQATLASLTSPEAITYRQQILADAVARPAVIRRLYDIAVAAATGNKRGLFGLTSGNDVEAGGKRLIMITGANQGGKSTFLRSVGLAQLMMQCGLFVAAESFTASVSPGSSRTSSGKRTRPWSTASWTRN